jgi:hypothetical protein
MLIVHAIGLNHMQIQRRGWVVKVLLNLFIYLILYISKNIRI